MTRLARVSTYLERLEMVQLTAEGHSRADTARLTGWSQEAVSKWCRRARRGGEAALYSAMGRPTRGILSSFPADITETIALWREKNPGWGAKTMLQELRKDERFNGRKLPGRSRIADYIKFLGKARRYQHHTELPQPPAVTAQAPHEEWELDAKGMVQRADLGKVCLIDLLDVYSGVIADALAVGSTPTPKTTDYQLACRRAFLRFGLPRRITLDHDTVFIERTCPSPFPRRFHLWLVGLGIEVRFIAHPPPREHSRVERAHRTMADQALNTTEYVSWEALNEHIHSRRVFMNTRYPSRAHGEQAPLQAYPEAARSGRSYTPQWEEELLDLGRVDAYLAGQIWYRPVDPAGQLWINAQRYGVGRAWAGHTLTIHFEPQTRHFIFHSEDQQVVATHPARGLEKRDLMGELPPWSQLPGYQLHLPFSPAACREFILYQEAERLSGTT